MSKKILLVDDEPELVAMVKTRLEANNYEVITAADGKEGLDKARKEKPDLIILDIMLPRMDGYKVCGLIKTDIKHNKIPVVMLTVKSQEADKKRGEEAGAEAYIIKPFEAPVLLEEIQKLLEGQDAKV